MNPRQAGHATSQTPQDDHARAPRQAQPNPLDYDGPVDPSTPVPGMPEGSYPRTGLSGAAGSGAARRTDRPAAPVPNPLDHDGPIAPGTPVPGLDASAPHAPVAPHRHRLHLPWGEHGEHGETDDDRAERQRIRLEEEAAEDRLLMYSAVVGVIVLVFLVVFVVFGDYA